MTETCKGIRMPQEQSRALRLAFKDFSAASDPNDRWANRRLSSVINAATAAGWSRRTVAAELGISRERALKISAYPPSLSCTVEPYRRGAVFPAAAVGTFSRIEQEISGRRIEAGSALAALIRSAHASGWPYHLIGREAGATGEWMRRIAESYPDTPARIRFEPYSRPLKGRPAPSPRGKLNEAEKQLMATLAAAAREATKAPADEASRHTLPARMASEQLSALIIAAKKRRVTWADLDEACGYRPGSARARAVRHGYGKLPPSMTGYSRHPANT